MLEAERVWIARPRNYYVLWNGGRNGEISKAAQGVLYEIHLVGTE